MKLSLWHIAGALAVNEAITIAHQPSDTYRLPPLDPNRQAPHYLHQHLTTLEPPVQPPGGHGHPLPGSPWYALAVQQPPNPPPGGHPLPGYGRADHGHPRSHQGYPQPHQPADLHHQGQQPQNLHVYPLGRLAVQPPADLHHPVLQVQQQPRVLQPKPVQPPGSLRQPRAVQSPDPHQRARHRVVNREHKRRTGPPRGREHTTIEQYWARNRNLATTWEDVETAHEAAAAAAQKAHDEGTHCSHWIKERKKCMRAIEKAKEMHTKHTNALGDVDGYRSLGRQNMDASASAKSGAAFFAQAAQDITDSAEKYIQGDRSMIKVYKKKE